MDFWSIESGSNCNFDQIQEFAISMSQDDINQHAHKDYILRSYFIVKDLMKSATAKHRQREGLVSVGLDRTGLG